MKGGPLPKSRVLVLIADVICGRCLARELADRGEGAAGTSVFIVAPALVHSLTAAWTDDIDAGIAEAERKVEASVALLRRQGYTTVGKVGDSNPTRAIEDGLTEFVPDSVIVATHPADRMGLLERELVDRLAHDGTGATRVVMAPDGDFPPSLMTRDTAPDVRERAVSRPTTDARPPPNIDDSTTEGVTMIRSKPIRFLAGAAALPVVALAVAGCGGGSSNNSSASAATAPPKTASGQSATVGTASGGNLGTILVDSQGRTLYLFEKDSGTKSACSGACATNWPPLRDSGKPTAGTGLNASLLGTTPRSDGNPQVTYNGHPLYTFVMDQKPGDTKGQGVSAFGGSWFTLNSAGSQVTAQPTTTSTSGSSGGGGYGY